MDYVEAEGDSIDDAIERALAQLGVAREKVAIEIVSDATKGLFGLGGRKARVRATLRSPLVLGAEPAGRPGPAVVEEARPPVAYRSEAAPLDGESFERARSLLAEITRQMGIDVSVEAIEEPDGPRLALSGDKSGILIGRRGQTLDALEYIVNRIVARSEEHHERIVVDSENYRLRRRESLQDLARRTAARVRERGKAVTLNAMSPRDRRVVHLALEGEPSVTTRSSGTGFFRRLTVLPAAAARDRSGGRRH
jgi:spoIIIJ-associated protein